MKITNEQLQQIIKEELELLILEQEKDSKKPGFLSRLGRGLGKLFRGGGETSGTDQSSVGSKIASDTKTQITDQQRAFNKAFEFYKKYERDQTGSDLQAAYNLIKNLEAAGFEGRSKIRQNIKDTYERLAGEKTQVKKSAPPEATQVTKNPEAAAAELYKLQTQSTSKPSDTVKITSDLTQTASIKPPASSPQRPLEQPNVNTSNSSEDNDWSFRNLPQSGGNVFAPRADLPRSDIINKISNSVKDPTFLNNILNQKEINNFTGGKQKASQILNDFVLWVKKEYALYENKKFKLNNFKKLIKLLQEQQTTPISAEDKEFAKVFQKFLKYKKIVLNNQDQINLLNSIFNASKNLPKSKPQQSTATSRATAAPNNTIVSPDAGTRIANISTNSTDQTIEKRIEGAKLILDKVKAGKMLLPQNFINTLETIKNNTQNQEYKNKIETLISDFKNSSSSTASTPSAQIKSESVKKESKKPLSYNKLYENWKKYAKG